MSAAADDTGDSLGYPDERFRETVFFAKVWAALLVLILIYLVFGPALEHQPLYEAGHTVAAPQHDVLFTTRETR